MSRVQITFPLGLLLVLGLVLPAPAQFDPQAPEPPGKLPGALLLHGGSTVSPEIRSRFIELAGGPNAKLVVIPSADSHNPLSERKLDVWREQGATSLHWLHAESRAEAERPEFAEVLADAMGVWISGGWQTRLSALYVGTPVEKGIQSVLARGGIVGGSSAGAAICSRVMLVDNVLHTGFDLLPGTMIDQHFRAKRREPRLLRALEQHPDRLGIGINERTALLVRGRTLEVLGESEVEFYLAAGNQRPLRHQVLKPAERADWISLARAVQARQSKPWPVTAVPGPQLAQGSLIVVGGGGMPADLITRFIELAGGPDAPLVYIPCEEREELPSEPAFVNELRKAGARQVSWLHTKDRRRANESDEFLAPLRSARGVWFGGGRQWNLVDSYQHTTAHRLIHEVLSRGGVIGGSSAGASIQGDYMPRGDPLGNTIMMAEGYEQGLGLLTGVAIDQHFTQRNRLPDLQALVRTYPQFLGIGIDEGTAIVVQGETAEVVGKGQVCFLDGRAGRESPAVQTLVAGQSFLLPQRRPSEPLVEVAGE